MVIAAAVPADRRRLRSMPFAPGQDFVDVGIVPRSSCLEAIDSFRATKKRSFNIEFGGATNSTLYYMGTAVAEETGGDGAHYYVLSVTISTDDLPIQIVVTEDGGDCIASRVASDPTAEGSRLRELAERSSLPIGVLLALLNRRHLAHGMFNGC